MTTRLYLNHRHHNNCYMLVSNIIKKRQAMRSWLIITACVFCNASSIAAASDLSYEDKIRATYVTYNFTNEPLRDVLGRIQNDTGLAIGTQSLGCPISINVRHLPLLTLINHLATITGLGLQYDHDRINFVRFRDDEVCQIEAFLDAADASDEETLDQYANLVSDILGLCSPRERFVFRAGHFMGTVTPSHRLEFLKLHMILAGKMPLQRIPDDALIQSSKGLWSFSGNLIDASESIRKHFGKRILLSRGALAHANETIVVEATDVSQALRNTCNALDLVWDDNLNCAFVRAGSEPSSPVIRIYQIDANGDQSQQIHQLVSRIHKEDKTPVIRQWKDFLIVRGPGSVHREVECIVGSHIEPTNLLQPLQAE